MDQKRIEEIRARCDVATPGPWEHDGMHDEVHGPGYEWVIDEELPDHPDAIPFDQFGHRINPNYVFAAHARQDIPDLLAEVGQLQAENEQLRRELDTAFQEIPKGCGNCKHYKGWGSHRSTCEGCPGDKWQWRGPEKETNI